VYAFKSCFFAYRRRAHTRIEANTVVLAEVTTHPNVEFKLNTRDVVTERSGSCPFANGQGNSVFLLLF
jgi:hypothetical protein